MKNKRFWPALWALVLSLALWATPMAAWAVEFDMGGGNNSGDWTYDASTKVLTISGTGPIFDLANPTEAAWSAHTADIQGVIVEEGITSIGAYCFTNCTSLTSLSIPSTVTSIGTNCFAGCTSLTAVSFPESVTDIDENCFANCTSLATLNIPSTMTNIADGAFSGCANLSRIEYKGSTDSWQQLAAGVTLPDTLTVNTFCSMSYGEHNLYTGQTAGWLQLNADSDLGDAATDITKYEIYGDSGLSIDRAEVSANKQTVTLYFNGTVAANSLSVTADGSVFSGGNFAYSVVSAPVAITPPVEISNPFTVTFDPGEGTGSMESQLVPVYEQFTVPECTLVPPVGYTFSHWTINNGITPRTPGETLDLNEVVADTFNVKFTANWAMQPYTFTFDPAGGSGSMPDKRVYAGETFTFPECEFAPPAGQIFSGWLLSCSSDIYTVGQSVDPATLNADGYSITVNPYWQPEQTDEPNNPGDDNNNNDNDNDSSGDDNNNDNDNSGDDSSSDNSGDDEDEGGDASVEHVDTLETNESEDFVITGLGESYLQSMVKPENFVQWYDRVDMPSYTKTLYEALQTGSDNDDLADYLIEDEYYTLKDVKGGKIMRRSGKQLFEVTRAETLTSTPAAAFAAGDFTADERPFTQDEYMIVDVTAGDRAIDYLALREGDVVQTSTFNGIFVTRLTKTANASYEKQRQDACTYITTTYQAFDRDHPEIFWLSGKSKVRILTVTVKYDNKLVEEAYIFFTLVDNQNFSLRSGAWAAPGAVANGLQRRDGAIGQILASVDASASRLEQVRALNNWLTLHNEYNTSADLLNIGNEPHECLSALEGRTGLNGPVCDGYSRAFKTLCDRLNIPCVLADGYARPTKDGGGEAHMWNLVQMEDGRWYGLDVTWNDPSVAGGVGAVSGYENERYLLVGADTVINGLTFAVSHPATNRAANGGVAFTNGPTLNAVTYNAAVYQSGSGLPFADVKADNWYYPAVQFAYFNSLMNGNADGRFAPADSLSRAMLVQILYNRAGQPKAEVTADFADVKAADWFAEAVAWAASQQIAAGDENGAFAPNAAISREQLAVMLWRYQGSPEAQAAQLDFPDVNQISSYATEAMAWAVEAGVISGDAEGGLRPQASATRAEAAQMLQNLWAK